ncbi:LysM peptidoglycan-binding domain-containing protein [Rubritalea tangerina]|uniref:LysM peptidoglycan-binding domain-containing protein n=1 Tax=Rubritalea tangerina TaxID=430798 RepID=A0ABW4ZBV1_9BACT
MKNKELQTKRQTKKGFRKLHARVSSGARRKQRVSAAANPHMLDSDVPNASIGRALTIILVLHVVAIGVIYIGIKWNKGDFGGESYASTPAAAVQPSAAVDISNVNASMDSKLAIAGDSYESFAARHGVDVNELRKVNGNAAIHAGRAMILPAQKIQVQPAVVATAEVPVSDRPALPATNTVVNIEPVTTTVVAAPKAEVVKAEVVKPAIPKAQLVVEAGAQTYTVQPGDSVWRISHKYKVSQEALMQLNGMTDARQLQAGKVLKIPAQ